MKCHPRSGAALLIVLVAVAALTSTAAVLASRATAANLEHRASAAASHARDIARSTTPILLDWLDRVAPTAVLPPDSEGPRIAVHEAAWNEGGDAVSVRVTAFDLDAMPPATAVLMGSPVRRVLDDHELEVIDTLEGRNDPLGLDQLELPHRRTFPRSDGGDDALGARVSFAGAGLGSVHVHTAPRELLSWLFDMHGIGGLDVLLDARARGERIALALPAPDHDRLLPGLTASSGAWAFRIDVAVGACTRSWWSEYDRTGGAWTCRQRLAIAVD